MILYCFGRVLNKIENARTSSEKEDVCMKKENNIFLSYNDESNKFYEGKEMREIYWLIRKLGITSKYKGYYFVAEAVNLSMKMQERPMKITKDIYPILAKKFKSTPMNIVHDIRTIINVCWMANKEYIDQIAGYTLGYKPTNSEFIDMLAYYLTQNTPES